jgi:hypothetical protein
MEKQQPSAFIISFLTLRRAIGFLGIFLPAILLVGTIFIGKCTQIQDSISHYYYTIMGDVFVGILCMVAIFLISYRGYDKIDNIASNLAGVFAMIVAFFATTNLNEVECSVRFLSNSSWRELTHYIAAALFFITLAFMSYFLFTKSRGPKTDEKVLRNKIYRSCGIIIIASILMILMFKKISWLNIHLAAYKPVFWLEWIALAAFGTSWLVKGKFLFDDDQTTD